MTSRVQNKNWKDRLGWREHEKHFSGAFSAMSTSKDKLEIKIFVYRKGDIVKQPMKSRDVLPKNVPGVGWGGSCRGGVWWGGSCRGVVGWVI